jgi:hypothetical protein
MLIGGAHGDVRKERRLELEEDPCGRPRHRRSDRSRDRACRVGGWRLRWPLLTNGLGAFRGPTAASDRTHSQDLRRYLNGGVGDRRAGRATGAQRTRIGTAWAAWGRTHDAVFTRGRGRTGSGATGSSQRWLGGVATIEPEAPAPRSWVASAVREARAQRSRGPGRRAARRRGVAGT